MSPEPSGPKELRLVRSSYFLMRSEGAREGEIEALYRERFRAFALSATAMLRDSDAALDVVQDAFAIALRRRRSFRGEGNLEAWVWRIVLNVARDRLRARRRDARSVAPVPMLYEEGNSRDEVRELLLGLPERQRLAIFLHYYADLSYAQIGEVLGISSGTVSASITTARGSLRQQLQEATP
jgi:RNA polymerase sigma-70 factor, ECF subfamily